MLLHQNAQRLIEPLPVVNPYAGSLTFADTTVRTGRDHAKYLTLIAAVTLLHQHQRPVKTVTRSSQVIRYEMVIPHRTESGRLAGLFLSCRWVWPVSRVVACLPAAGAGPGLSWSHVR
jgi:hypothetical protein